MFKRKIEVEFDLWFDSLKIKKKALVIRGARQVGKTTLALAYAKKKFTNVVYLDFKKEDELKKIFENTFSVDNIIILLSAYKYQEKFIPNKTVLIFDEIQECANARMAIKYFMLDGRYDIIATGSLLRIRGYNQKMSNGVPTGFEWFCYMKSLDFEEYLMAKGISQEVLELLKTSFINKIPINSSLHVKMLEYFNEYLVIGGMPEVVDTYFKTKRLELVKRIKINILEEYKDDFGKHLNSLEKEYQDTKELTKILEVYNSIPNQLAKENKKFQYSVIEKNARSKDYRDAITYLEDAGIITLCYNLSNLDLPLEGNKIIDQFKIYVNDTGLFVAMLEEDAIYNILTGNLGIYKGAIYENIVADSFIKNNKKLYYFSKSSGLEIDFIIKINGEIIPVEVKARSGRTKSLKEIINNDKYLTKKGIKLTSNNISIVDNIINYPYYLVFLI